MCLLPRINSHTQLWLGKGEGPAAPITPGLGSFFQKVWTDHGASRASDWPSMSWVSSTLFSRDSHLVGRKPGSPNGRATPSHTSGFSGVHTLVLLCKRQHSPGAKRVNTSQTTESLFPGVLCSTVQLHLPSSGRGRAAPGREYKVTKDGLAQSRHSEGGWFMLLSGMGQL